MKPDQSRSVLQVLSRRIRAWLVACSRLRIGLVIAGAGALVPDAEAKHPRALWDVVHGLCLPDKRLTRLPFPCTAVDRGGGFAIVKDVGPTGYLLVPTRRLTGIEDPRLLDAGLPNYWLAAWAARRFVERRIGRVVPREDIGLAINAKRGRSQDQLHIHVDCVRRDVRDALAASNVGGEWHRAMLRGHPYFVRTIPEAELAMHDPFRLVSADGPDGETALGGQVMALIGRASPPGFFLITADASQANRGHAEELLDHACGVLE